MRVEAQVRIGTATGPGPRARPQGGKGVGTWVFQYCPWEPSSVALIGAAFSALVLTATHTATHTAATHAAASVQASWVCTAGATRTAGT